ncbi:hypothetical protein PIROE2DRAFT_9432 [Piromyces sp. E2]|nr:hypothetical protein PIROE2DRAFT_9432 [Piromyces sp. E2]|eukprot:OUM63971.1 hypothetical protein PIROE2DRAFT_9432 [Piromyces sp. E2]
MKYGVLTTKETKYGHAAAFSVMAFSDILCTIAILYFVRRNNSQEEMTHYIKRSSYIILICVDGVGILLAIMNGITEYFDSIPGSYVNPLHCIKCSFTLILSVDALLFKYSHTINTIHDPESNNVSNSVTSNDCNCTQRYNSNYVIDSSNLNIYGSSRL